VHGRRSRAGWAAIARGPYHRLAAPRAPDDRRSAGWAPDGSARGAVGSRLGKGGPTARLDLISFDRAGLQGRFQLLPEWELARSLGSCLNAGSTPVTAHVHLILPTPGEAVTVWPGALGATSALPCGVLCGRGCPPARSTPTGQAQDTAPRDRGGVAEAIDRPGADHGRRRGTSESAADQLALNGIRELPGLGS
jgi:hypothetical protein